jgi:hypothetical protein
MKSIVLTSLSLMALMSTALVAEDKTGATQVDHIVNADFETGNLAGWKDWRLRRAEISTNAQAGKYAVALGPESARCVQEVKIRPDSRYRLSAWVKTESGAEQVELVAQDYGGPTLSVASALTEYTKVSLDFTSAHTCDSVLVTLWHRAGPGKGYADSLELEYLGEAPEPTVQEFVERVVPAQKSEGGVATLPESDMEWYLDAKFGMFIHWGVYAVPAGEYHGKPIEGYGEWIMHHASIPVAEYKAFAKDFDKLVILGGAMGTTALNVEGVKSLATLPSLDELRAKLLGLLNAPATKIAGVLQAPAGQLARVFNAYATKEAA